MNHSIAKAAAAILVLALSLPPLSDAAVAGSVTEAAKVIEKCMSGKDGFEASKCIGAYSDPCVKKSTETDDYEVQSKCLRDEATAWRNFRDSAVGSFLADNGTKFSTSIVKAAQASDKFAGIKCAVYQDSAMFGQSGMSLETECLRDEAARMAIFISRELD